MSFSSLLKKVNIDKYIESIISIDDIKAQYNPNRFSMWQSLHDGPEKEVLNVFYSPHYIFLKQHKEFGIHLARVNKTAYYRLQRLYGRNDKWIKEKIYKFLDLFNSMCDDGYKEKIIVLDNPLVKNKYNKGFEIFEGHHRIACCLVLGMEKIPCKIIMEKRNENN